MQLELGLKGLWIGINTGNFSAALMCIITWLSVNWKKEVAKALEKMALCESAYASGEGGGLRLVRLSDVSPPSLPRTRSAPHLPLCTFPVRPSCCRCCCATSLP